MLGFGFFQLCCCLYGPGQITLHWLCHIQLTWTWGTRMTSALQGGSLLLCELISVASLSPITLHLDYVIRVGHREPIPKKLGFQSRVAQLNGVLLKLQGQVQYLNHRSSSFLIKQKCVAKQHCNEVL